MQPKLLFTFNVLPNEVGHENLANWTNAFVKTAKLAAVTQSGDQREDGFRVVYRPLYTSWDHAEVLAEGPSIHFFLQHASSGDDQKPQLILRGASDDQEREGSSLFASSPNDRLVVFFACNVFEGKVPPQLEVGKLRDNLPTFWETFRGYHFVAARNSKLDQLFVNQFLNILQTSRKDTLVARLKDINLQYGVEVLNNATGSPFPWSDGPQPIVDVKPQGCCCGPDLSQQSAIGPVSKLSSLEFNREDFLKSEVAGVGWGKEGNVIEVGFLYVWLTEALKQKSFTLQPVGSEEAYRISRSGSDVYVKIGDNAELSECSPNEATLFTFYQSISHKLHLWNEAKHVKIVEAALGVLEQSLPLDDARKQCLAFVNQYKEKIIYGLKQADIDGKYTNGPTYSPHFYNPQTNGTYWDSKQVMESPFFTAWKWYYGKNTDNAKICAMRYSLAATTLVKTNPEEAAFNLGLALHYLTDLSQPFHAADAPNYPTDWRHSAFEIAADKVQGNINVNHEVVVDVFTQGVKSQEEHQGSFEKGAEQIVFLLATLSNSIFQRDISLLLQTEWKWSVNITSSEKNVQRLVPQLSTNGANYAVALILLWAREAFK